MAAKTPPIDFKAIAAAALNSAEQLLSEWLPHGKREGHEFKSLNPTRGDNKAGSFSININTGAWGDFATNDKGGDLVSLCAYLFHEGDQVAAAREIAERFNIAMPDARSERSHTPAPRVTPDASIVPPISKMEWRQIVPVPEDAPPPPVAHFARGKPQATWTYRDGEGRVIGYIYRFTTSDGGKETIPVSYGEHVESGAREWRWRSFEDPRPLYGLDVLAQRPNAWVLLVEGEKCAEAAEIFFSVIDKRPVVMTWPGGCKAVDKVDWAPLKGCNVILWPDCDAQREKLSKEEREAGVDPHSKPLKPASEQPGTIAMERIARYLLALGEDTRARIVNIPAPGEKPDGWDIYDAINSDGLDAHALIALCRDVRDPIDIDAPAGDVSAKKPRSRKSAATPKPADAENGETPVEDDWYARLVRKKGDIVDCLANVFDMLDNVPQWQGVLGYDESAQAVVKLNPPPFRGGGLGEWSDQDDTMTAMWLSRRFKTTPSTSVISRVVDVLARENTFHPIRDWMNGLQWDGVPRLNEWMTDWVGVEKTPYTMRVSRWFIMGLVYRIMEPGCQLDYCLVLEGEQGLRKSSILRAIGGEWFGDTDLDLHNKDSMDALRGKMLYEFAEMGSITKVESSKQKSFITRRIDEFRPSYGTRTQKFPRQVAFSGTVNEWEWNKDPTGGRRFWPIRVTCNLDVESFMAVREQLFAEAVAAYRNRERYWPTPEEQKKLFDPQQLRRMMQDSYLDILAEWLELEKKPITLAYALSEGLKLDASKHTRDAQTRCGVALVKLGWMKKERKGDASRFVYMPPERDDATLPAQPDEESDIVPF